MTERTTGLLKEVGGSGYAEPKKPIHSNKVKPVDKALVLSGGGARGAFQVGAMRYLADMGWVPDLICGTSVGAINGVAYAAGMPLAEMESLWRNIDKLAVFRPTPLHFLRWIVSGKINRPLLDTRPLRMLVEQKLDFEQLRSSPIDVIITAINVRTSRLVYFFKEEINVAHLMASTAIPLLFPWSCVDGEHYWDGGLMDNTPLLPALHRKAREIIVITLSPAAASDSALPSTPRQAFLLAFEQFLIGSYRMVTAHRACNQRFPSGSDPDTPRIYTLAPRTVSGPRSILNFGQRQAHHLLREGYETARSRLSDLLTDS